jgi:hypothetical protein
MARAKFWRGEKAFGVLIWIKKRVAASVNTAAFSRSNRSPPFGHRHKTRAPLIEWL